MLTPRKLIAFLTLALTLSSTLAFADCGSLGTGWVQGTSSGGVTVCVPTGDNPTGAISSGTPVLTQNGKDYYAPPSSMADKLKVDSTGRIGRTLDEVTRITRADGSVYVYTTSATFYTEAGAASTAMWDKVKADPASFPTLQGSLTDNSATVNPSTGAVVTVGTQNYLIGGFYNYNRVQVPCSQSITKVQVVGPQMHVYGKLGSCQPDGTQGYDLYIYTFTTTTSKPTWPAVSYSAVPAVLSDPTTGPLAASELDKLISQNPDSFKKSYTPSATEGITAPPIPTALTPEKIAEIYAGNGAPLGTGGPKIGSGGTPTLSPPVEIPQPFGSGGGGGGGGGDPTQPPTSPGPDIYGPGYTPGFNGSPYGSEISGGADFGNRLSQFMSDLRGSSLFSLPTSILGNIPGSGTSAIFFDGGRFGQQSFDFSAFSNQLMIIRSVLLLCFSLLSIRIVTLKR